MTWLRQASDTRIDVSTHEELRCYDEGPGGVERVAEGFESQQTLRDLILRTYGDAERSRVSDPAASHKALCEVLVAVCRALVASQPTTVVGADSMSELVELVCTKGLVPNALKLPLQALRGYDIQEDAQHDALKEIDPQFLISPLAALETVLRWFFRAHLAAEFEVRGGAFERSGLISLAELDGGEDVTREQLFAPQPEADASQSIAEGERAISAGQTAKGLELLGRAARHLERAGAAHRIPVIYERISQLDPDNQHALQRLVEIYRQRGDHARALRSLQQVLRRDESDIWALRSVGDVMLDLGNREKARWFFEREIQAHRSQDGKDAVEAAQRRLQSLFEGEATKNEHPSTGAELSAYLVVTESRDPAHLGQRIGLDPRGVVVGRHSSSGLCVRDEAISRRHCLIARPERVWVVRDFGSANGTYVNNRKLTGGERRLDAGDILSLAGSVLVARFIVAPALEAAGRSILIGDPETGAYPIPEFTQVVDQRLAAGPPMQWGVLALELDGIKDVNESLGKARGDEVLRSVAELIRASFPGAALGRQGPRFYVLLTDIGDQPEAARRLMGEAAHRLQSEVEAMPLLGGGSGSLRATVGGAPSDGREGAARMIQVAENQVRFAAGAGSDRIAVGRPAYIEGHTQELPLPVSEGRFHQALISGERAGALVAFEPDYKDAHQLGLDLQEEWHEDLRQDVLSALSEGDLRTVFQSRIVLVLLGKSDPECVTRLIAKVLADWSRRGDATVGDAIVRRVPPRLAVVKPAEVKALKKDAISLALQRLAPARDLSELLPFPLVAHSHLVVSQDNALQAAQQLTASIELGLKLLSFAQLGAAIAMGTDDDRRRAAEIVRGKLGRALNIGDWNELTWRLTGFDRGPDIIVACLNGELANRRRLRKLLNDTPPIRNNWAHRVPADPRAFREARQQLEEVRAVLLEVLQPLADSQMVAMFESTFDAQGRPAPRVYLLQGPNPAFIPTVLPPDSLAFREWCYLRSPEGHPVLLAPGFAVLYCESCNRPELFAAEGIWPAGRSESSTLLAPLSQHATKKQHSVDPAVKRFGTLLVS